MVTAGVENGTEHVASPAGQERETFSGLLRVFREAAGRSRHSLAHEAGVDPSYLTRLELESRDPPRRNVVDALSRELQLSPFNRDRLLVAGGHTPQSVVELGRWDKSLAVVANVLNNTGLEPIDARQFRNTVLMLSRWVQAL